MAPSHILQIFLRVTIQNQIRITQWVIIDEIIQLRPLRHGHIQRNRGILLSEENKKSEPFSYREKVRIFIVWCE